MRSASILAAIALLAASPAAHAQLCDELAATARSDVMRRQLGWPEAYMDSTEQAAIAALQKAAGQKSTDPLGLAAVGAKMEADVFQLIRTHPGISPGTAAAAAEGICSRDLAEGAARQRHLHAKENEAFRDDMNTCTAEMKEWTAQHPSPPYSPPSYNSGWGQPPSPPPMPAFAACTRVKTKMGYRVGSTYNPGPDQR